MARHGFERAVKPRMTPVREQALRRLVAARTPLDIDALMGGARGRTNPVADLVTLGWVARPLNATRPGWEITEAGREALAHHERTREP